MHLERGAGAPWGKKQARPGVQVAERTWAVADGRRGGGPRQGPTRPE